MKFSQFSSDALSFMQVFSAPAWALQGLHLPSESVTFSGMGPSRCRSVDSWFYLALHGFGVDIHSGMFLSDGCSSLGSIGPTVSHTFSLTTQQLFVLFKKVLPKVPHTSHTWLKGFSCVQQWVKQELTGIICLPHRATLASPPRGQGCSPPPIANTSTSTANRSRR